MNWNFELKNGHTFEINHMDGTVFGTYDRNYFVRPFGGEHGDRYVDIVERETGSMIINGLSLNITYINGSPAKSWDDLNKILYIPRHSPVNFIIENEKTFTIERMGGGRPLGSFARKFKLRFNRNGTVSIVHIDTEIIILEGLTEDVVFIHGEPLKSWELLRMVIYNFMCACSGSGSVPPELAGIFDETFDETFE